MPESTSSEQQAPEHQAPERQAPEQQAEPGPRRRAFLVGAGAGAAGAVAGVAGGFAYRATRPAPASQIALENSEAGLLPPGGVLSFSRPHFTPLFLNPTTGKPVFPPF